MLAAAIIRFSVIFMLLFITRANAKPNVLLVVTDDQDSYLHGMFPLRQVQKLIGEQGAIFNNAFTTSPLCCPSRASILSGLYAHNHKTFNNSLNGGCNGPDWHKVEADSLPVVLQNAGYETFFAGKYLNQYYGEQIPVGWDNFHGLHGNSKYYNFTLRQNAQNHSYTNTYLTDLLRDLSLEFLTKRAEKSVKSPFFAIISPPAPHQPFTPAERHINAFAGIKALRTPNFNIVSQPWDKHWLVSNSKFMEEETVKLVDSYFQRRWETLLSVDEMVANLTELLEASKELDNTYIIYTSDNGYHMGQFAQPYDKRQPYETDIRVPFLVRGPNIAHGTIIDAPITLIDLMPTILEWAEILPSDKLDGISFNKTLFSDPGEQNRAILIQHWGEGNENTYNSECPWKKADDLAGCTIETFCHCQDGRNNTYACVRHFRYGTDRLYCEFRDDENFVEAYDLIDDPYQLKNLGYDLLPIERALYSLALSNLTRCTGASCTVDINV